MMIDDPFEDYERRRPKAEPPRKPPPCYWCGDGVSTRVDCHVPESVHGGVIYACRMCNTSTDAKAAYLATQHAESLASESGGVTPTPTKGKPKKAGSVAYIPRPATQPGRVRNYGHRSGSRAA